MRYIETFSNHANQLSLYGNPLVSFITPWIADHDLDENSLHDVSQYSRETQPTPAIFMSTGVEWSPCAVVVT
ncbi:hypothetical protein FRB95_003480 [Tulasnella sp. JGI-2019a]|nr:hypothetical protein FRB95_003480 [Tulasnella sp. JGI-2019a]